MTRAHYDPVVHHWLKMFTTRVHLKLPINVSQERLQVIQEICLLQEYI